MRRVVTFLVLWSALLAAMWPNPGLAYNGDGAANYADQWATSNNTAYPVFNDDCTNFVSQAMYSGGFYPFRNSGGSPTDDHNWWVNVWNWDHSNSWAVSPDLRLFLYYDVPGGWEKGTTSGEYNNNPQWDRWPSDIGLGRGDVLFYDWGPVNGVDQGWSHSSMLAVRATYSSGGWYGDVVDTHSDYHFHAFWDLSEFNLYTYQTWVNGWHVDAAN